MYFPIDCLRALDPAAPPPVTVTSVNNVNAPPAMSLSRHSSTSSVSTTDAAPDTTSSGKGNAHVRVPT